MAILLVICSAFMAVACREGNLRVNPANDPTAGISGTGQRNLRDSIGSVLSSPYLRAIAVVICISSFATTITGWQFKALAKQFSAGQDAMAQSAGIRMLIPVGRSGWAIAAGYMGLLSIMLVPAPLAIIFGILAIRDIKLHPDRHGMGRAIFGIVMGSLIAGLFCFRFFVRMIRW